MSNQMWRKQRGTGESQDKWPRGERNLQKEKVSGRKDIQTAGMCEENTGKEWTLVEIN